MEGGKEDEAENGVGKRTKKKRGSSWLSGSGRQAGRGSIQLDIEKSVEYFY